MVLNSWIKSVDLVSAADGLKDTIPPECSVETARAPCNSSGALKTLESDLFFSGRQPALLSGPQSPLNESSLGKHVPVDRDGAQALLREVPDVVFQACQQVDNERCF